MPHALCLPPASLMTAVPELIWRYLTDSNADYRETAAKFQKEWHIKEPHQEFPFAPHVKGHALVSIINRGLLYHALERQHIANQVLPPPTTLNRVHSSPSAFIFIELFHHPSPLLASTPPHLDSLFFLPPNELSRGANLEHDLLDFGIFGPLVTQPPAQIEDVGAALERASINKPATVTAPPSEDLEINRKRHQQQLLHGSPIKRQRLGNSPENGLDAGAGTTPMDVDTQEGHQQQQHEDNHAYPSPLEGEQATTPMVHTDGPEQGTQVDKVEELLPDTTFIRLGNDSLSSIESDDMVNGNNAPILLQCEWSPKDPTLLAAAGTDALARVWSIPRGYAPDRKLPNGYVSPDGLPLLDPETPSNTTVTALAWATDGLNLAVAVDMRSKAAINICSSDGMLLQTLTISEPPVVKLAWSPQSTSLLSISPEKTGAIVTVYESSTGAAKSYVIPGYDTTANSLDATWTSENEFLLGGGDMFVCLRVGEASIDLVRKYETRQDDSFRQVLYDPLTKITATSSEKGVLDLWDEAGQRKSITAHRGPITTMAWQPLSPTQARADDERLIATGGEDCAILIWNARRPESKTKCFLTMGSPIVRLAFTPDGAFIAGATATQVLIWKVENTAVPRATWTRPSHAGWSSPKESSESEEEDEHCLCWDASGQKLAYGSNSRLAVINFSR
ncbi:unnamed protein product [Clonostachys rosea f. rosea IK726]|uniref:Uncharacterized protein n=1 Tax=Clonostachys rosea f. rosea IK726 TaxID=1349383 RepID=A0ACA9TDN9_BIOOC|nr:unnamed protein product [Clonostachys rosea f. rosea IK726]